MAKYRKIQTRIWLDRWFSSLTTEERLLWLYLMTNRASTISGLYEVPVEVISAETRLPRGTIEAALARFERDRMAYFRNGAVWICELRQIYETPSRRLTKRIEAEIDDCPDDELRERHLERYPTPKQSPHRIPVSYWDQQRLLARGRDNYECQRCGISEEEYGGQLDVHHLRPRATFALEADAHELSNLVTLCDRCHGKMEHEGQEDNEIQILDQALARDS